MKIILNKLINKKSADELIDYFKDIDSIFGLFTFDDKIPVELEQKLWDRYNARKTKDFATSDKLRKELDAIGYVVSDIPNGFTVQKK